MIILSICLSPAHIITKRYLWSNTAVTEDLSNVAAGVYTVTVTDFDGCTTTASATVTEPTALTATVTTVGTTCNAGSNGAVDLTVGGGTGSYSCVASSPSVNSSASVNIAHHCTHSLTQREHLRFHCLG